MPFVTSVMTPVSKSTVTSSPFSMLRARGGALQNGDEVTVDFDTGVITDVTKGTTYQAEPFPPFIKDMIARGGLMASLKAKEAAK